jgi:hypothetical protein
MPAERVVSSGGRLRLGSYVIIPELEDDGLILTVVSKRDFISHNISRNQVGGRTTIMLPHVVGSHYEVRQATAYR